MTKKLFEFAIIASGLDPESDQFEDRLIGTGCDDATVSCQRGFIVFDFARNEADLETALRSAIDDVLQTDAKVLGIEPSDLVSLADIARRADMTRAAISNYFAGTRGANFPLPVDRFLSENPLWSWKEVSAWLCDRERVKPETVADANAVAKVSAWLPTATKTERQKHAALQQAS